MHVDAQPSWQIYGRVELHGQLQSSSQTESRRIQYIEQAGAAAKKLVPARRSNSCGHLLLAGCEDLAASAQVASCCFEMFPITG